MKYVKITVILLFVLSLGLYGAGRVKEKRDEDPTRPVITSDREVLEISVNYGEEELFAGLTAQDERDGDLTDEIIHGKFSQFIEPGVCNLGYVVFDSSNQAGTLSRKVRFVDYESPKLSLSRPLVLTIGEGESAIDSIGASDVLDGSLSDMVKQVSSTVDYRTEGDYTVSVEVSNSFGDVEEQTLPVHIVSAGRQELQIELSAPLVYLKAGDSFDPHAFVTALTSSGGEALDPALVQADSQVNTAEPGCYEVHYSAVSENGQLGETWMTVIVRA